MDSVIQALRLGATDYLLKPFEPEQLVLKLENWVNTIMMQEKIKVYESVLPICCLCHKVKETAPNNVNKKNWLPLEEYLSKHSGIIASHTYCPVCADKFINEIKKGDF